MYYYETQRSLTRPAFSWEVAQKARTIDTHGF